MDSYFHARAGVFVRSANFLAVATAAIVAHSPPSFALTIEEARENCRATVGRPIVQACMGGQKGEGPAREACRAKASPAVKACVTAALNKAHGTANVAISVDDGKNKKPSVNLGNALPAGFVPPPRSIADIAAVLDNTKPDAATLAEQQADANKEPARNLSGDELAEFYLDRATARSSLGRASDAIADAEKGLAMAADPQLKGQFRIFMARQRQILGDLKSALAIAQQLVRETDGQAGVKGFLFLASRTWVEALILAGDPVQADGYLKRVQARLVEFRTTGHPKMRESYALKGRNWEGEYESSRGLILEARGQYRDAEAAYKKASDYKRSHAGIRGKRIEDDTAGYGQSEEELRLNADTELLNAARMKAKQGRLAEAEVDARAVLLSRLKAQGKYNPASTKFVMGLAGILIEQGRYGDGEKLIRAALDIQRTVGIGDDSQYSAQILSQLGAVLTFQGKVKEAAQAFAELDKAIAKWEPRRREVLEFSGSRIFALYASGQIDAGLAAARELVKREVGRVGERHFDAAAARGTLARGLALAGRDEEAVREFRAAIPVLMAAQRENAEDDDETVNAARSQRLQAIVEAYIGLLAKSGDPGQAALEAFSLADAIRGHSVQKALAASSARSVVKDAALAELVRKEQDLGKQINGQLGSLNNALASNARDDGVINATKASIDKLRADRLKVRDDIAKRFPSYAELIDPKPPSVDQIRETLRPGEAMLSYYFGRSGAFVWAVPKEGAVAFAAVKADSGDIESRVRKLREALEPNAPMIADIPPFEVALAHELYALLLKPVEAGWKQSNHLIVVTNGALGLLPLSLLPTAPAQIETNEDVLFASYRKVPWLARTHAVTMVPSSAALRTLRNLPPGKGARSELIAFGDPYFSPEQEDEAIKAAKTADASGAAPASLATRGIALKRRSSPKLDGVDSAELAMLPRLPDTADELKSIALALQADPSKVLNLGKEANEDKVKRVDLSGFKVLAFATHGLVPGELNGLTQPALALSAPAVAGGEGDGLLTMEEILALKLDADWVVLSACNTGSGAGAGAEAASGLGRAFFYAGTRALLVTNWSVHSQSARELVTDLFRRQAADKTLTRGEALRQAMIATLDGAGFAGPTGAAEFTYAHPLFWAPYTIIGDGG